MKNASPSKKLHVNCHMKHTSRTADRNYVLPYRVEQAAAACNELRKNIARRSPNSAPPRLQRMLLKLTKYDLDVCYILGKQQIMLHCLRRAPLNVTESTNIDDEQIKINRVDRLGLDNDTLSKFRVQTSANETSRVVMEYVLKGWPTAKDETDELAREYWSFGEELSVEDGLLFKSERIVVPSAMRAKVLDEIHGDHMGE